MDKPEYAMLADREQVHWWHVSRRRILSDVIDRLDLPPSARILEVGCGTGGNLAMLSRFGSVAAVEYDETARHLAMERSQIPVQPGQQPNALPFAMQSFDLVVAFDVIEHIDDDRESIRTLLRAVKPGGWFLSTVPAYGWMWSEHDIVLHHKRRYSLRPYAALVRDAGFRIRKKSYFNTFLFPVAAVVRIAQKLLGKAANAERTVPTFTVNRALIGIFSSEAVALRSISFPFGLSILVAAQRPAA